MSDGHICDDRCRPATCQELAALLGGRHPGDWMCSDGTADATYEYWLDDELGGDDAPA
ncbi:hypothetical protein [Streptomyces rimosus]|uniref:hypothetical protein n=1 Tax=Streptomyces rimosus TaxID=1927 RepID=UPI00131DCA85|nr:hypothetical protein [Streptomyces rimosus]